MKKFLIYSAIGIGILIGIFVIIALAVTVIAKDEAQREQYAYNAGFVYGVFIVILIAGLILFGLFRLTIAGFVKDESKSHPDDQPPNVGKDEPLDRYLQ